MSEAWKDEEMLRLVKAAMEEELGALRIETLPMEDNQRRDRQGGGQGMMRNSFPPKRKKPVKVNPGATLWHSAIKEGEFEDDDAEQVKELDKMGNGRLHDKKNVPGQNNFGSAMGSIVSAELQLNRMGGRGNIATQQERRPHQSLQVQGGQRPNSQVLTRLNQNIAQSAPVAVYSPHRARMAPPAVTQTRSHPANRSPLPQVLAEPKLKDPEPSDVVFRATVHAVDRSTCGPGVVFLCSTPPPGRYCLFVNGLMYREHPVMTWKDYTAASSELTPMFACPNGSTEYGARLVFQSQGKVVEFMTTLKDLQKGKSAVETKAPAKTKALTETKALGATKSANAQTAPRSAIDTVALAASASIPEVSATVSGGKNRDIAPVSSQSQHPREEKVVVTTEPINVSNVSSAALEAGARAASNALSLLDSSPASTQQTHVVLDNCAAERSSGSPVLVDTKMSHLGGAEEILLDFGSSPEQSPQRQPMISHQEDLQSLAIPALDIVQASVTAAVGGEEAEDSVMNDIQNEVGIERPQTEDELQEALKMHIRHLFEPGSELQKLISNSERPHQAFTMVLETIARMTREHNEGNAILWKSLASNTEEETIDRRQNSSPPKSEPRRTYSRRQLFDLRDQAKAPDESLFAHAFLPLAHTSKRQGSDMSNKRGVKKAKTSSSSGLPSAPKVVAKCASEPSSISSPRSVSSALRPAALEFQLAPEPVTAVGTSTNASLIGETARLAAPVQQSLTESQWGDGPDQTAASALASTSGPPSVAASSPATAPVQEQASVPAPVWIPIPTRASSPVVGLPVLEPATFIPQRQSSAPVPVSASVSVPIWIPTPAQATPSPVVIAPATQLPGTTQLARLPGASRGLTSSRWADVSTQVRNQNQFTGASGSHLQELQGLDFSSNRSASGETRRTTSGESKATVSGESKGTRSTISQLAHDLQSLTLRRGQ